jgi:hypothetical protein
MTSKKIIEKLDLHEEEYVKDLKVIAWCNDYLLEKRNEPNYKPPKINEFEIIEWCEKFLKERKTNNKPST